MTPIPPRPTLLDAQVKLAYPPLARWFVDNGGNAAVEPNVFIATMRELFKSAKPDAYQLAKTADLYLKWTAADAGLVAIFADVLTAAPDEREIMEAAWVMENGVRVSQKPRDAVLFMLDGELCHGIVQNVLAPRAQLVVVLIDSLEARTTASRMFRLNVEDIIERNPEETHAAV